MGNNRALSHAEKLRIDKSARLYYNTTILILKETKAMEDNIIILEDQDGVQVEFETIDVFEFNGVTYFALLEVLPEEEENDEVLIMQVQGEDDDMELVMVDDDEKLQAAFEEFCRRDAEARDAN